MSVCRLDPFFISDSPKWPKNPSENWLPSRSCTVGSTSQKAHGNSELRPGFAKPPGQRTMLGERTPPSNRLRLWPERPPVELKKAWGAVENRRKKRKMRRSPENMPMISHEMVCVFSIFSPFSSHTVWPQENVGKDWENEGEEWRNDGKNWENGQTPKKALGNQGEIMGIIWKNYEKS